MRYLVAYLIIINLLAFFQMYFDKSADRLCIADIHPATAFFEETAAPKKLFYSVASLEKLSFSAGYISLYKL